MKTGLQQLLTVVGSGLFVGGLVSFFPQPQTPALYYAGVGVLSSTLTLTIADKTGEQA